MGVLKVKELRAMPDAELQQRLAQTQQDLVGLRLKASHGPMEQPHRIRLLRQEVARILTLLREGRQAGSAT